MTRGKNKRRKNIRSPSTKVIYDSIVNEAVEELSSLLPHFCFLQLFPVNLFLTNLSHKYLLT